MINKYLFLFFALALSATKISFSQEIEFFSVKDFDLHGRVKTCLVITDYGKEEYHFDQSGRLIKSVTRYNDADYETTFYKYDGGHLIERRVENYLDNAFDEATSIANFYTIDTVGTRKVTEKIITYGKELLEQNVYYYDDQNKLTKIESTDTAGTDENTFTYIEADDESMVTHKRNALLAKTIKTSKIETEDGAQRKSVTTKSFIDGELNTQSVEVYDEAGRLLSKTDALYDGSTKKWIPQESITYTYGEDGVLATAMTRSRHISATKEYIHQYDGSEANNWVKQIVTPDNEYTTRRITYYDPLKVQEE